MPKRRKTKPLDFKRFRDGRRGIDHSGCGQSGYKCCADCQKAFDQSILIDAEQVRALLGRIPRTLVNMTIVGERALYRRKEVMSYV